MQIIIICIDGYIFICHYLSSQGVYFSIDQQTGTGMSNQETKDQMDQQSINRRESELPKLASSDLFKTHKQVIIVHEGNEYLLRVTRQGKLILTK